MIGVLGLNSTLVMLYWAGLTWVNEMNFVMNSVPGAGAIARLVDQQSSELPLYHRCPLAKETKLMPCVSIELDSLNISKYIQTLS